jgi:hypothetical protein
MLVMTMSRRRAWDAQAPELPPLIAALATQLEEPAATPVRERAPTSDQFLADIRRGRWVSGAYVSQ